MTGLGALIYNLPKLAELRICDNDCFILRARARVSGEIGEGGGFGFECRDGIDEARHGEGVADAAFAANEAEDAAFTGELDGDTDQRGDAGTIDLGNAIEYDHDFAGAALITDSRAS